MTLRTRLEAQEWLIAHGVSILEFSRAHNIKRQVVNDIFRGRTQGRRGEAHRAMVLLGIKPAPTGASPLATPLDTQPQRRAKSAAQAKDASHG